MVSIVVNLLREANIELPTTTTLWSKHNADQVAADQLTIFPHRIRDCGPELCNWLVGLFFDAASGIPSDNCRSPNTSTKCTRSAKLLAITI